MPIRTNRGRAAVYRRLWGWPMRSPTHLVVLLVVVAVLVIAISVAAARLTGDAAEPGGAAGAGGQTTTTTAEGQAPGSTERGTPGGQSGATTSLPTRILSPTQQPTPAAPAPEALEVAEDWGRAWVDHPEGTTAEEWLDGLRPYTTEEYMVEMASVDPANVPATELTGSPEAAESFTSSVTVELPTNGGTIAITVIDTPEGWRVAFYEQVA